MLALNNPGKEVIDVGTAKISIGTSLVNVTCNSTTTGDVILVTKRDKVDSAIFWADFNTTTSFKISQAVNASADTNYYWAILRG